MCDPIYISFIGEKAVGKSSIIATYESGNYNPDLYATESVETHIINAISAGSLRVYIHDMAGETHIFHSPHAPLSYVGGVHIIAVLQKTYRATVIALCATCNVIVLVYDKTYRQSFGKIDDFHKIIIQHIDSEKVVVVLLGNKIDETHKEEVTTDEGYNKHKYLKTDFFIETSAKTGHNINVLFKTIEEEEKTSGKRP